MVRKLDLENYGPEIKLIERNDWGAIPATDRKHSLPLELPVLLLRFTETGVPLGRNIHQNKIQLQNLQAQHMVEENAEDIKFNFAVGTYSIMYEGRGFTRGPHNKNGPDSPHIMEIAYCGKFDKRENKKIYLCSSMKVDLLPRKKKFTQRKIAEGSIPFWEASVTLLNFIKYGIKNQLISPMFRIID
ncbi:peptidoglycan recognition protein 1-like [Macrosteles quadrilineatus]|uniref:peptidoglycan recognition protein 1-like n=1 Tax=Macrosteles quadrilineatus TaxID=74068 RepID=UPI0023E28262|nr:peptidoglycan recognition protein 1-like [Macrosteles quadrilineatus]